MISETILLWPCAIKHFQPARWKIEKLHDGVGSRFCVVSSSNWSTAPSLRRQWWCLNPDWASFCTISIKRQFKHNIKNIIIKWAINGARRGTKSGLRLATVVHHHWKCRVWKGTEGFNVVNAMRVAQSHWGWIDAEFLAHHARVTLHNTFVTQRRQDSSSSTTRPGRLTVDCVWTPNLVEHFVIAIGRARMFRKVYIEAGGRRNAGWSRIEQLTQSVYHLHRLYLRQRFS